MNELFHLQLPWYEFILRGAACYLGLLTMMRLAGKRAFGEMSPFDIVVLMLVGGALRSALVGSDTSLVGPFIAVATILCMDSLIAHLSARVPWLNAIVEGREVLIARMGQLLPHELQRHGISTGAFNRELREKGIVEAAQIEAAFLEANGRISVIKRKPRSNG
jgi:uncharacterized membrane protein YcaP (DUF421 family)